MYGRELIIDLHQCDVTKFNRRDLERSFFLTAGVWLSRKPRSVIARLGPRQGQVRSLKSGRSGRVVVA